MKISFFILGAFLLVVGGGQPVSGQTPVPQKEQVKKISLIALGTPPMPEFIIQGGKRALVDGKEDGSYPPQMLFLKKGKEMAPVPVALNTATSAFDYPASSGPLVLSRRSGQGDGERFHTFLNLSSLPEFQNLTILVCRRSPKASWFDAPKTRILKNDLEAFPLQTVRAVNLSSADVGVRIDGVWKRLGSGSTMILPMNTGKDFVVYDALYQTKDGKSVPLARSQAMRVLAEDRTNMVFYDNDGPEMVERPVKLLSYPEVRATKSPASASPASEGTAVATTPTPSTKEVRP